jgi:hypothetical protein
MALDTCNVHHGVKANGRCRSCLKPLCPKCAPIDGCCSARCAEMTQRFASTHVPPRPRRHVLSYVSLAAILAAAYFVARYLGYIH